MTSQIAIALSGGIDSAVAAAALQEEGHSLIGVTMSLASGEPGRRAAEEARETARHLGIPHHLVDLSHVFEREIIQPFVRDYAAGRTPNPCARCNPRIKFGVLKQHARALGAEILATGHYARIEKHGNRMALRRALDDEKDQSYALAGLAQDQLEHAVFPLGGMTKEQTRQRARDLDFPFPDRPESQEICFVEGDYRAFLAQRLGPPRPGDILSVHGVLLGRHHGLAGYTIGQRKGLGIAAPNPLYVIRIDPERNALIVGEEQDTYCPGLVAGEITWCSIDPPAAPFGCSVQIRYNHKPVPCTAAPAPAGFEVRFAEPLRAVAPGQLAVLYDGDLVLASGTIVR